MMIGVRKSVYHPFIHVWTWPIACNHDSSWQRKVQKDIVSKVTCREGLCSDKMLLKIYLYICLFNTICVCWVNWWAFRCGHRLWTNFLNCPEVWRSGVFLWNCMQYFMSTTNKLGKWMWMTYELWKENKHTNKKRQMKTKKKQASITKTVEVEHGWFFDASFIFNG